MAELARGRFQPVSFSENFFSVFLWAWDIYIEVLQELNFTWYISVKEIIKTYMQALIGPNFTDLVK